MGDTTLLAISTLLSEINFYTRLMKMRDPVTHQPIFTFLSVELACPACKADGKASQCVHMLHLVPRWQSSDRHVKLKTIMQDRPDLIESELSGLAFDSNQQIFKSSHIDTMFRQPPPASILNEAVYTFIDPAAGGPQSDYAVLSVTRHKGLLTVSLAAQVGLPYGFHKRLVAKGAVLDPSGDQLVTQGIIEALCLEWAEGADHEHPCLPLLPDVAQIASHCLVLVQQ